ncbi:DUF5011 domain-containing protein [Romboutsia sedimentorum]|uniref:immunoglobulin-like domain-containing protein n=1 Tax=Romboutsia sedimentorum TaxID=1368474 RepID=UPI0024DEAAD1|nr:immunoglobulin-like domain-containing protein [Romboutsia sedimentorum]MDK2584679.1 DUF5011 domain-containing protein [Romboutsia sedimentorum]
MKLRGNPKLRKVIVASVMSSMMVGTLLTPLYPGITAFANENQEVNQEVSEADFGVGQGIQWPKQVNAPYVDMLSWITKPGYTNNGTTNLVKIAQDTGVKFFNLGFIQSISNQIKDGKIQWGWGGYTVLNEANKDNDQYMGIKKSIRELREIGGDVTFSLGGANGVTFWEATQDVDVLTKTYEEIIKGYGITRLDLDIEGGASQSKANNIANAKAIKKVQDETGVDIVLTLPVLPSGLTQVQLDVLEAYLSNGVDIELVNIMTMCYGSATLNPGENYGTASVRAIDSTKNQVKDYFKKYLNVELSDQEAYRKVGTTSSIGFESSAHPTFTKELSKLVVDHAIEKGIGMTSFWSMNRDAMLEDNAGVSHQYEFTNLFKEFGKNGEVNPPSNSKPTIYGVLNKNIAVGDIFDAKKGITATDREDGDITDKIVIEGKVDTSKEGIYKLTYTVQDSEGLKDVKECNITVKKVSELEDTYDSKKIYNDGDTVIYKGHKYTAKWWVQGEAPDLSEAWVKEVIPYEDGSVDFEEGSIYVAGEKVRYQSKLYKANWWTKTTPGSDDSWSLIGNI